jgi:ribonuclease T1
VDRIKRSSAVLAALLAAWPLAACSAASTQSAGRVVEVDGTACSSAVPPPSGMTVLALAQLPATAISTLKLIAAGGPYPYDEDGTVFGNYQRLLPREPDDYYHEFTVADTGAAGRGPRRVVTGAGGQDYYTPDHYVSFDWISCAPPSGAAVGPAVVSQTSR